MEITKDTRVSEVLQEHGDIPDVVELFGIKRVGRYSFRRMLIKALTVEIAVRVSHVPLEEFPTILQRLQARKARRAKAVGPSLCPLPARTRKAGLDRLCQRAAFCVKQGSGFVFGDTSV